MDEDNEPGRCKRSKPGYSRGVFNGVSNKDGFARARRRTVISMRSRGTKQDAHAMEGAGTL